jgi:predicted RNase H-like HicB family nuclease
MSDQRRLKDIVSGQVSLNIVYRKAELDDGYIAECVKLPGCMSQGDTDDEAKANIVDAIQSCISVLVEDYIKSNSGARDILTDAEHSDAVLLNRSA